MIDPPSNLAIPKPESSHLKQTSSEKALPSSMAALQIKGDGDVAHRNSVTNRDSNSNLAAKKESKKVPGQTLPAKKSNLSGAGHAATVSDPTGSTQSQTLVTNSSEGAIKEEDSLTSSPVSAAGSKSATAQSGASSSPKAQNSSLKDDNNPLKARFISFSKRIKGTVAGFSHTELPKVNKTTTASSPAQNSVDLKNKNNSSAKLPSFNKNNAPSASAYDITLHTAGPPQLPKTLEDYYVIRRVGKGGFATVFLVRLKASSGRYYALKVIRKSEVVRLKQEKQIMNEKNILFELKHPLLIDLYNTFQTPSNLFMVLEFVAGGDLFTLLRKSKMFIEPQAKFYVCEVLTVLEYLHSMKVVYRDLKPENILLDSTGHIKLADFGFAKKLTTTTSSFCGTPDYIAAEIVASRPYSFPVDWWSLGVLVFELTSGKTPFRADDSEGIYTNIQIGKIQWVPEVNGPIKELCAALLETDPRKRLGTKGAEEIKKAAWFAGIQWEKIGHRGINPPVVPSSSTPETLEMEKLTKGGQTDYSDILGDSLPNGKFTDPFEGAFKGF